MSDPTIVSNNLILELHVPDFTLARTFYSIFGFDEINYDPASSGGNDLGYMVLLRKDPHGQTRIHFFGDHKKVSEHSHFRNYPHTTPRGYAVEITIPVHEIDLLWAKAKDKLSNELIAQPLVMKRWGKKDFRVIDPFGFYVRFTELVDWDELGK